MVLLGQHGAEAGQDFFLYWEIELVVAPGRDHELARRRFVIFLHQDASQGSLAGAGERRGIAEEGAHSLGACIAQEESNLGPFPKLVLARPLWIGGENSPDVLGRGIVVTVAIFEPGGKLSRSAVLDARDRGMGAGIVAPKARTESILQIGGIGGAQLIIEQRLQDGGISAGWRGFRGGWNHYGDRGEGDRRVPRQLKLADGR